MGNEGFFELGLLDVENRKVRDPKTRVEFSLNGNRFKSYKKQKFPPARRFKLPAFPQGQNLYCEITPSRYCWRRTGFFTLMDKETISRQLTVLRIPEKWNPKFKRWNELPVYFQPLKRVLAGSPSLVLKGKQGRVLGKFVEKDFDKAGNEGIILAKACLLNLFVKMTELTAPAYGNNWFFFVRELLEIRRDRFIAFVDPKMGEQVRKIKQDIGRFVDYKNTLAGNHFKNIPRRLQPFVKKGNMFSIKSDDNKGNLQITLPPGTDSQGKKFLLLDADIDENGKLLAHFRDWLKHRILKRKTHPYEIHEYLRLTYPKRSLGYELV